MSDSDQGRTVVQANAAGETADAIAVSLSAFAAYFLRLGAVGFGGPIALAGYMQRDLVERLGWVSKQDYLEGVALAQLSPGPLAAQLAMYLGWVRGGIAGATIVGAAFIIPSFAMVLALSVLYLRFGGLPWMQGIFYGVGAAVTAIIIRSVVKLVKLTVGGDRLLWGLFAVSAVVTAWTRSEIVWMFLGCGVISVLVKSPPGFLRGRVCMGLFPWPAALITGLHGPAHVGALWRLFLFFMESGAVVFGSGLAIVPFLYGGVVQQFHWLNERQFLDAVAVAMITPGPVIITVGFIGYLAAGPVGAILAAVGVFVPCYLFVIVVAPHFRRLAGNPQVKAFVQGITASASGAIAGAALILALRAIVDLSTSLIALCTLILLFRTKRVPEPAIIAAAGALGLLLFDIGHSHTIP